MCGIFCFVGTETGNEFVIRGLKKVQYRGYDTCGVSVLAGGEMLVSKGAGSIDAMERSFLQLPATRSILGHTRWATHGEPTELNAHPMRSGRVSLVHNGVIENYLEIRRKLIADGTQFATDTDTEVALKLIERLLENRTMEEALTQAMESLKGRFAVVVQSLDRPKELFGIRRGSPLILGRGVGGMYFASDVQSLGSFATEAQMIAEDHVAIAVEDGASSEWSECATIERMFAGGRAEAEAVLPAGVSHFMLKEILETPDVLTKLIDLYSGAQAGRLGDFATLKGINFGKVDFIQVVACGSAYHAALIGRSYLERLTHLPVFVDLAHEYRHSERRLGSKALMIAVSQSGETADTLACAEMAKRDGCQVVGLANQESSTLAGMVDRFAPLLVGREVAVASTKAVQAMILAFYLIAVGVSRQRGLLSRTDFDALLRDVGEIPLGLREVLGLRPQLARLGKTLAQSKELMFIGKGLMYPVALEAALKCKEIAYLACEGLAAGELKHGPLALITKGYPVVVFAGGTKTVGSVATSVREAQSRGAAVTLFGGRADLLFSEGVAGQIEMPSAVIGALAPMVALQAVYLMAYECALSLGTQIDRPRNLAKSVTVE